MKQNNCAASTVKAEPGQAAVSTGLYSSVCHPMYAGAQLLMAATPLALGSYWALLVLIPILPLLAWPLLNEERFLTRNLTGYADYWPEVRYRPPPASCNP